MKCSWMWSPSDILRSVLQFVRKGEITVGSSCQSVESRKVRDPESAIVFSFPGKCCAEITMFL